MRKLNEINKDYLGTLDPDVQKIFKVKRVQNAFARAVARVFKSPAATRLVLENVQAVYVMRDTRPYKQGATPEIYLQIYSSDSTVRSELDMCRDWIRLALIEEDIHYDDMKIYASKLNMKKRKPYKDLLEREGGAGGALADSRGGAGAGGAGVCASGAASATHRDIERHNLTDSEISEIASRVQDEQVRAALTRALHATRSTG